MKKFVKKHKMKKMPHIHLEHEKHAELHHKVKNRMHSEIHKHFIVLIAILVIVGIIVGSTMYYLYALNKVIEEKKELQLDLNPDNNNTTPLISSEISFYSLQQPQFSSSSQLRLD